jgi:hypothetical protein
MTIVSKVISIWDLIAIITVLASTSTIVVVVEYPTIAMSMKKLGQIPELIRFITIIVLVTAG